LFHGCQNLASLDLSSWNTANVTDMESMFNGCSNLTTISVGPNWNTDNVSSSQDMFYGCTDLVGIMGTTYDENHTDKTYARIDKGIFEPGYLTGELPPRYTFDSTTGALELIWGEFNNEGKWGEDVVAQDVTSVTAVTSQINFTGDCSEMFKGFSQCLSIDLNSVNTSGMTNVNGMFQSCQSLTSLDLSTWNTAYVTSMDSLFADCSSLTNIDVSSFNTECVTSMQSMFDCCMSLTELGLTNFNTANVTDMESMFNNCSSLTILDLTPWNTANVTDMDSLFNGCTGLTTIYVGMNWSTENVSSSENMFNGCTELVGGMGTVYDENHIDKTYARIDGGEETPGYFSEAYTVGDVNDDSSVNISDVTTLIDYLLSGDATGVNTSASDCNMDGDVNISDVTTLIDYLLSGNWPR
jgi:surface protein